MNIEIITLMEELGVKHENIFSCMKYILTGRKNGFEDEVMIKDFVHAQNLGLEKTESHNGKIRNCGTEFDHYDLMNQEPDLNNDLLAADEFLHKMGKKTKGE